jgi:hypothetical protein
MKNNLPKKRDDAEEEQGGRARRSIRYHQS